MAAKGTRVRKADKILACVELTSYSREKMGHKTLKHEVRW